MHCRHYVVWQIRSIELIHLALLKLYAHRLATPHFLLPLIFATTILLSDSMSLTILGTLM